MTTVFDVFSSRRCNVCYLFQSEGPDAGQPYGPKGSSLSKCTGCNLAMYCSELHQCIDWSMHKELCRATKRIMTTLRISHPLLVSGQPTNADEMERAKVQLKYLLRVVLQRPLYYHEEELTSFPAYCEVCYSVKKLKSCPNCVAVSYCSTEHMEADKKHHKTVCFQLKLYVCPLKALPPSPIKEHKSDFPGKALDLKRCNLVEALQAATKYILPSDPTASLKDYRLFTFASDFSCVGTLCYALSFMDMSDFVNNEFKVFILGAKFERRVSFGDVHTKFFFFFNPLVTRLCLVFVGPECLEEQDNEVTYMFKGRRRYIRYITYKGFYQDMHRSGKEKPSLIDNSSIVIAYNCGFSENAHKPCITGKLVYPLVSTARPEDLDVDAQTEQNAAVNWQLGGEEIKAEIPDSPESPTETTISERETEEVPESGGNSTASTNLSEDSEDQASSDDTIVDQTQKMQIKSEENESPQTITQSSEPVRRESAKEKTKHKAIIRYCKAHAHHTKQGGPIERLMDLAVKALEDAEKSTESKEEPQTKNERTEAAGGKDDSTLDTDNQPSTSKQIVKKKTMVEQEGPALVKSSKDSGKSTELEVKTPTKIEPTQAARAKSPNKDKNHDTDSKAERKTNKNNKKNKNVQEEPPVETMTEKCTTKAKSRKTKHGKGLKGSEKNTEVKEKSQKKETDKKAKTGTFKDSKPTGSKDSTELTETDDTIVIPYQIPKKFLKAVKSHRPVSTKHRNQGKSAKHEEAKAKRAEKPNKRHLSKSKKKLAQLESEEKADIQTSEIQESEETTEDTSAQEKNEEKCSTGSDIVEKSNEEFNKIKPESKDIEGNSKSTQVTESDLEETEETSDLEVSIEVANASTQVTESDLDGTERKSDPEVNKATNIEVASTSKQVTEADLEETEETSDPEVNKATNIEVASTSKQVTESDLEETEKKSDPEVNKATNIEVASTSKQVTESDLEETEETSDPEVNKATNIEVPTEEVSKEDIEESSDNKVMDVEVSIVEPTDQPKEAIKNISDLFDPYKFKDDEYPNIQSQINTTTQTVEYIKNSTEEENDTWTEALMLLLQSYDLPIVFTSYTSMEAEFDYGAFLQVIKSFKLRIQVDRVLNCMNPYRDLRPLRNWQHVDEEGEIFHNNGYLQIVRTMPD